MNDETKLKIGASAARTRRGTAQSRHIVMTLFGKPPHALTAEEHARYRRLTRMASYYRRHETHKDQQRQSKQQQKRQLLDTLGWAVRCMRCGYDRYIGSLHFHHRDPAEKDGEVTSVEEALKCDLLCANCHGEAHRDHQGHTGRPLTVIDPWLRRYMELSGCTAEMIAAAFDGRPV